MNKLIFYYVINKISKTLKILSVWSYLDFYFSSSEHFEIHVWNAIKLILNLKNKLKIT